MHFTVYYTWTCIWWCLFHSPSSFQRGQFFKQNVLKSSFSSAKQCRLLLWCFIKKSERENKKKDKTACILQCITPGHTHGGTTSQLNQMVNFGNFLSRIYSWFSWNFAKSHEYTWHWTKFHFTKKSYWNSWTSRKNGPN